MHIHIHIYISFKITLASLGDVYIPNYLLSKETSQTQRGRSSRRASSINSGYSLAFSGKPALPGAAAEPQPSSLAPASLWSLAPLPFPPRAGPRAPRTLPGVGRGLARLAHRSHPG